MSYMVNEIFYSLQGEGRRAGEPTVFLRFTGCNLTCKVETHDFDCDTEFASGRRMDVDDVLSVIGAVCAPPVMVIATGGEPALQLDATLVDALHTAAYTVGIETNGSKDVSQLCLDWITVSPKVAEHALRQLTADEVKYVRCHGQGIPRPRCVAEYQFISPAFNPRGVEPRTLQWCIQLVQDNLDWALSVQQHKAWGMR